jgi:hypothetical protein
MKPKRAKILVVILGLLVFAVVAALRAIRG